MAIFEHGTPPNAETTTVIVAGELKTPWTVCLQCRPVTCALHYRAYVEPFIGM